MVAIVFMYYCSFTATLWRTTSGCVVATLLTAEIVEGSSQYSLYFHLFADLNLLIASNIFYTTKEQDIQCLAVRERLRACI